MLCQPRATAGAVIELFVSVRGAHPERRHEDARPRRWNVVLRNQHVATLEPQHGAAVQKEWYVRAKLGGYLEELIGAQLEPPQRRQRAQRRGGVAAAAAQSRLHRYALDDPDRDARRRSAPARSRPHTLCRPPDEIRRIGRTRRIVAPDAELTLDVTE